MGEKRAMVGDRGKEVWYEPWGWGGFSTAEPRVRGATVLSSRAEKIPRTLFALFGAGGTIY